MDVGVDAYASAEQVSAYLSARGIGAVWDAATPQIQEASIIEATAFLDANYSWVGQLEDCEQALGWPRVCARDKEGRLLTDIPTQIVNATAELANLALSGRLAPMSLSSGLGNIKSEQIGDVRTDYDSGGEEADPYGYVTMLLRGLCINSNSKKLIRA